MLGRYKMQVNAAAGHTRNSLNYSANRFRSLAVTVFRRQLQNLDSTYRLLSPFNVRQLDRALLHLVLGSEKAEYLFHHTVSLLGLKQKLGMRGTFKDDQLFGFRSLVKPCPDVR